MLGNGHMVCDNLIGAYKVLGVCRDAIHGVRVHALPYAAIKTLPRRDGEGGRQPPSMMFISGDDNDDIAANKFYRFIVGATTTKSVELLQQLQQP